MKEQLASLFGMYSEAVFAISGDEIVYYNTAARKLLPNINRLKPGDILPEAALTQDSDSFVGETNISGEKTTYSAARLGEYRIFSLISTGGQNESFNAEAFSAMSVEMKDYLTAYRTAASIVLPYVENTGDDKLGCYAAIMNKCYYNILRLASNMEVLGFGSAGGQNLVRESFDLVEACAELIEGSAQLAGGLDINMTFDSALDELEIYADRDKITQMMLNMLSNSLINTPPGGTVALAVSHAGENAIIKVSDTGSGIPESVKKSAWSGYGKPRTATDTKSGAGFGLAAVSQVARLHGGNVLFDSREGSGTTIAVSIPVEKNEQSGLKSTVEYYRSGGYSPILTGLSTVIEYKRFMQKYMD